MKLGNPPVLGSIHSPGHHQSCQQRPVQSRGRCSWGEDRGCRLHSQGHLPDLAIVSMWQRAGLKRAGVICWKSWSPYLMGQVREGGQRAKHAQPSSAHLTHGSILWISLQVFFSLKEKKCDRYWFSFFLSPEIIMSFLYTFYAFIMSFQGCVTPLKRYLIFIRMSSLQGESSIPHANRFLIVRTEQFIIQMRTHMTSTSEIRLVLN